jgi:hypothetical protein
MNIQEILTQSPEISAYGGGKWSMYSVHCCWWTSFPEDLGRLPAVRYDPKLGRITPNPEGIGLPCCPHCKSVLMQGPLEGFIAAAQAEPGHYGRFGLDAFLEAFSRNAKSCYPGWDYYNRLIWLRFHPSPPARFA